MPGLLLLASCGSEPTLPPTSLPITTAPAAQPSNEALRVSDAPPPRPTSQAKVGSPPALGPWLDPAFDLHAMVRRRARLARTPAVRAEHDGSPLQPGSDLDADLVVPVLETQSDDGSVRVACEGDGARVALFVARDELADVARSGALLVGPAAVQGAGLRVIAGTRLHDLELDGERAHARLEMDGFRATGTLARAHVDRIFEPDEEPPALRATVELDRGTLLDAPDGTPFLLIDTPLEQRARLRATSGAYALIELRSPLGTALGWTETQRLRPLPPDGGGSMGGVGGGERFHSHATHILLPRGRLLRVDDRRVAIGVMVEDSSMWCFHDCAGRRPVVEVCACGACMNLEAMGPGVSSAPRAASP